MTDTTNWDWEPGEKRISLADWREKFTWVEEPQASPDGETVAALRIILAEEVRHVAIGTRWFRYCCEESGVEPLETFMGLLGSHLGGMPKGPFNLDARFEAGFTAAEMEALTADVYRSMASAPRSDTSR